MSDNTQNVSGSLPSVEKSGAIAVTISENVHPALTAQEQALFVAGFQECIKWLSNNNHQQPIDETTNPESNTATAALDEPIMVEEKSIEEFREAGLLLLTNQFLHIFGWALTVNIDEDGTITKFYPAHCKFRGFASKNTSEAYEKVTRHLAERMPELLKDIET